MENVWSNTKKDVSNILPPNMLHIGDNCFANIIFQSLAFMEFEEEAMHYMKASDIWNNGENKLYDPSVIPIRLVYNTKLVSTFPIRIFRDFEPNEELLL